MKHGTRDTGYGIRAALLLLSAFILPPSAFPQQPQAQGGQAVFPVNAKYVNGVAPGYWPTAGTGMTLNIGPGSTVCGGTTPVTYAGGTLTMTASATNYVYLNASASCAPASNTTGFSAGNSPIAIVTAGSSSIAVSDWRPMGTGSSGSAALADPGSNGIVKRTALNTTAIAVAADFPTLNQSTTGNAATATALAATPTQCGGSNFTKGIAANGNANCGTPAGGVSFPYFIGSSFNAFGDSITAGYGATTGFVQRITNDTGLANNNYGVSGDQAADIDTIVFGQTVTSGSLTTIMIGTNDSSHYGVNSADLLDYEGTLLAELTWAAIPTANIILANSSNVTLTGTWSSGGAWANSKSTTSVGATATIPGLFGKAVYITIGMQDSQTGQFALSVDGSPPVTVNCYGYGTISTVNGRTYAAYEIRLGNLSNTTHTAVLTFLGGSVGYFLWAAASGGNTSKTGPMVQSIGIPLNLASYNTPANTATYNGAILGIVKTLASDGLNVSFTDVNPLLNMNSVTCSADGTHPTDVCAQIMASAIESTMNAFTYPRDRTDRMSAKGMTYDADGDPVVVSTLTYDNTIYGTVTPTINGNAHPALLNVPAHQVLAGTATAVTPIAYVWGFYATAGGGTTATTAAMNIPSGSLIACATEQSSLPAIIPTLADTAGNTFIYTKTFTGSFGPVYYAGFYALNVTGNAADVVTATWGSAVSGNYVWCANATQMVTSAAFDQIAFGAANGVAHSVTTQPFTTTSANEVAFGFTNTVSATTTTAGAGYTLGMGGAGSTAAEYQQFNGYQVNATASINTSNSYPSLLLMTFKTTNGSPPSYRALVAADIPSPLTSNTSGNAATATALAATPSQCGSGYAATGVAASGAANCMADQAVVVVASGSTALGTTVVASGSSAVVTAAATGAAVGNFIVANFHGSPVAVTGFVPGTGGGISIAPYITAGNINFLLYNNSSSSITVGTVSVDWLVEKVGP